MNKRFAFLLPSYVFGLAVAALGAALILLPPSPSLAQEIDGDARAGELIYRDFCVMCHSRDGRGVQSSVPDFTLLDSPLARNDGLLTVSDNTLLLHILDGFADDRVTGVVVDKNASDALTLSDIRNVLAYVHTHFHYQTHAHAGQLIYNTTCVACHGQDGEGAIPGMPDLGEMDGVMMQSDTILLDHILNGFESRGSLMAMPARGANIDLTIADLQNVLDYLQQKFHYRTFNGD